MLDFADFGEVLGGRDGAGHAGARLGQKRRRKGPAYGRLGKDAAARQA
jgi:hypothetical protein